VREVAETSTGSIVEGFHYLHHPVIQRLRQIVASGRLGELRHVEIDMQMAAPPDDDPRWSYELGARAGRPAVDEWMTVDLAYPDGLSGTARWNMASTIERRMTWTIMEEHGSVTAPGWPVPHLDDRVVLTTSTGSHEEFLGRRTSYTYQLEALAGLLRAGEPFGIDVNDAVASMTLVDQVRGDGIPAPWIRLTVLLLGVSVSRVPVGCVLQSARRCEHLCRTSRRRA